MLPYQIQMKSIFGPATLCGKNVHTQSPKMKRCSSANLFDAAYIMCTLFSVPILGEINFSEARRQGKKLS